MKRVVTILAGLMIGVVAGIALAGDVVEPASGTVTSLRSEAQGYLSSSYYFMGSTLRLTNCVIYAGTTTNSAVQGLDGVAIELKVGTAATNVTYAGTAIVASNGTWWCDITVPDFVTVPYLQIKVTDENTNSYIYPWKIIRTQTSL